MSNFDKQISLYMLHVICMKMYLSLFSKFAKSFNLSSSFSFPIWSKLVTSSIGCRCCPNIFPKQPKPSFYSLQFYARDLRPILILSKRSLAIFFIQKIHNIRIRWNFYHHQAFLIIFVYFLFMCFSYSQSMEWFICILRDDDWLIVSWWLTCRRCISWDEGGHYVSTGLD